jgi:hypothetical protein
VTAPAGAPCTFPRCLARHTALAGWTVPADQPADVPAHTHTARARG